MKVGRFVVIVEVVGCLMVVMVVVIVVVGPAAARGSEGRGTGWAYSIDRLRTWLLLLVLCNPVYTNKTKEHEASG